MTVDRLTITDERKQYLEFLKAAKLTKQIYDAYVGVGFSKKQAFKLARMNIDNATRKGLLG